MKKGRIAVIFQGIGYNADKPLLYYSKKIALERDYDVKVVEYSGIDKNCLENKNKMLEAFDLAAPFPQTFSLAAEGNGLVFYGDKDPWTDTDTIRDLCNPKRCITGS